MATSVSQTQTTAQTMNAYAEELLRHGDFAQYFTDDVVCTVEGTDQTYHGREAVRQWIDAAHSLGEVRVRNMFVGEGHATIEADFVRTDTVSVPYSVIYELADGQITALRLYFTGPVQE